MVILAHLESQLQESKDVGRHDSKWRLIRSLYDKGSTGEAFRRFLNLIDWFLVLPPELERRIELDISKLEQESNLPLPMSRYERNAIEQGKREERQEQIELIGRLLKMKYNDAASQFSLDEIATADGPRLREIIATIVASATFDEFMEKSANIRSL